MDNEELKKKLEICEKDNDELKKKLEACEKERDEYLNGWKRAKADFINAQKDEAKRFEEILKFGQTELIKELITTLDSFDLAIAALEKDGTATKEAAKGLYLIRSQIEDVLKKRGLERMVIKVGQLFDPSLQEAIGEIESDQPAGTIIEEIERGYLLHGRVIRPARVKISKGRTISN